MRGRNSTSCCPRKLTHGGVEYTRFFGPFTTPFPEIRMVQKFESALSAFDAARKISPRLPNIGPANISCPSHRRVWRIRSQTSSVQVQSRDRQQASRLRCRVDQGRGCCASAYTADRATVGQKKTGRSVRFELSEQTRQAVDDYLKAASMRPGEFLFTSYRALERSMTTRQYARVVSDWIGGIGLDPRLFGTHSLRRTKATLTYRRTGNLRAVQLLLGHTKIESTVRYLGIELTMLWQ